MDCLHWWCADNGSEYHTGPDDIKWGNKGVLEESQRIWVGLAMRSAGKEVVALLDNVRTCCEDWAVRINGHETMPLLTDTLRRLHKSNIQCVGLNVKREKELTDLFHHYLCVDIVTDAETFKIDLFSEHNGYYPHTVYLAWPGHEETTDL